MYTLRISTFANCSAMFVTVEASGAFLLFSRGIVARIGAGAAQESASRPNRTAAGLELSREGNF